MLVFLSSVLLLSHTLASTNTTTTYDTFKLVRQWYPNSCYKASPPCISRLPRVVKYWTIHGLWPSRVNCTTCHFNPSNISDLEPEMHLRWPSYYKSGGDARFWKHEYCTHGTCCTDEPPSPHKYFSTTLKLNRNLNMDKLLEKAKIVPRSKPYTFKQLDKAMEKKATYWCRTVAEEDGSSRQYVYQISLCMDKKLAWIDCSAQSKKCYRDKPFYLRPFKKDNTDEL